MAVLPIIPDENVNIQDIIDTLEHNGAVFIYEDVDDNGELKALDLRQLFSENANHNIFSKRKPVILKSNFCQDYDSNKPNYYPEWWKGIDGNCGIKFKNVANINELPDIVDGELNGWEYNLPQGGANAPLRLGDFCGYDPNAKPFVEGFSLSASIVENNSGSDFIVNFITTPAESKPTSLNFSDLSTSLGNYYAAIYMTNGNEHYMISSSNTVGNSGTLMVTVPTTALRTGKWSVYAFLSEVQIPTLSTLGSIALGYCYTLPYTNKLEIEIVSTTITIVCNIMRPQGSNVLNATIYVTYPSAKTFVNNNLYLKLPTNNNINPGIQDTAREQIVSIPSFSVAANTRTLVYNSTINLNTHLAAQTSPLKYVLSLDGGSITRNGSVISSTPMPAN